MTLFASSCLFISILIYIIYILYVWIKYKPDCMSQSYYLLKNRNIFTIWIISIAFLTFPAWVEISQVNFQFLPFLSVIALIVVGLFPKYLNQDRTTHITGVYITCTLSLIWNIISGTMLIPVLLGIILLLLVVFKVKNKLFWIECLAFSNIYLSIITKLNLVL